LGCSYCGRDAVYSCGVCGKPICPEHVKLRTLCTSCVKERRLKYLVACAVSEKERRKIGELVRRFWGEEEQLTFDRKFTAEDLPALVAEADGDVIGFLAFAELADAVIIVALGVLPEFQGSGVGKGLVEKLEDKARSMRKRRLLVSTSNDDLPALAFYQSSGFQIYEVKPNVIAEKHGEVLKGIGGLPIRDELRLQKNL
jgi:ribosomal protein S18 acetylase RimI-like enzyme